MSEQEQSYLRRLERALAALPRSERDEIIAETRSHIRDRTDGSSDVAQILSDLGTPDVYAAQFLIDRVKPDAIESVGTHAATASTLLLSIFQATLGTIVVLLCALAIAKIANPAHVGVWYTAAPRHFQMDIGGTALPAGREIFGYWLAPIALLLAGAIYTAQRSVTRRIRTRLAARANART